MMQIMCVKHKSRVHALSSKTFGPVMPAPGSMAWQSSRKIHPLSFVINASDLVNTASKKRKNSGEDDDDSDSERAYKRHKVEGDASSQLRTSSALTMSNEVHAAVTRTTSCDTYDDLWPATEDGEIDGGEQRDSHLQRTNSADDILEKDRSFAPQDPIKEDGHLNPPCFFACEDEYDSNEHGALNKEVVPESSLHEEQVKDVDEDDEEFEEMKFEKERPLWRRTCRRRIGIIAQQCGGRKTIRAVVEQEARQYFDTKQLGTAGTGPPPDQRLPRLFKDASPLCRDTEPKALKGTPREVECKKFEARKRKLSRKRSRIHLRNARDKASELETSSA